MLNLVPLAGARWEVMDFDIKSELGCYPNSAGLLGIIGAAHAIFDFKIEKELLLLVRKSQLDTNDLVDPVEDGRKQHGQAVVALDVITDDTPALAFFVAQIV